MADSIKSLVRKAKYNSINAKQELEYRISNSVDTGLRGFNNEKITFNLTDDIHNYMNYIDLNINSVSKCTLKEIVILESYSSATIEGAKTTIKEIRKALSNSSKDKSQKMVLNTIASTQYAIESGISDNNIRNLWEIVIKDVCENKHLKGNKYRSDRVVIGNRYNEVVHEPCPVDKINQYMQCLFDFRYPNILIYECIVHFYFVYIHPFCDGNGRTARVWTYSDLIRKYNTNFKYISISNEILNTVQSYYKAITESEFVYANQINITTFIEYLLECMCNAIRKGKTNSIKLNSTDTYIIGKINTNGITVDNLKSKIYSESSIRNSLNKLTKVGILYRVKEKQHYRYFKSAIN